MKRIDFSHNWNNKLDCQSFTTLRLKNGEKYQTDELYEIYMGENQLPKLTAKLLNIKEIKLYEITEWIAQLDAGCSLEEFKEIIKRIYPDAAMEKAIFQLILLTQFKD
jgi:uncharacterized protein YqfB (UPF0267 family)